MLQDWAISEMLGANVGHGKRNISLGKICTRLAQQQNVSFSAAAGSDGRQSAHRIFSDAQITPLDLLSGHIEQSVVRASSENGGSFLVLVAQDTTTFDFSTHTKTTGLGPIGKVGTGLLAHSALSISPFGCPLGVVDLHIWPRIKEEEGKRHVRRNKPVSEKESYKWTETLQRASEHFDFEQPLLFIQDREADIFAFMAHPRRENVHLLVRAAHPRLVEIGEEQARSNVFDAVEAAAELGTFIVDVPRRPDQPFRKATLSARACQVTLLAPVHRHADDPSTPQPVFVVQVHEENVPADVSAIEWTLLSTLPVTTLQEAEQFVRYYTYRWLIERLHYTLKSGGQAERLQIDDAHSLSNALAIYYVVAWRLLYLTYLARTTPEASANVALTSEELLVLAQAQGKPVTTIAEAIIAIAKQGGYTYYRNAPPPGVKVLWIGLRRLKGMLEGFKLALQHLKQMNQD